MMKKIGNIIRIALVIVVIALIFMNLKNGFETNINYSEMVSAIKQEKVKKIKIASDKTYVRYIYNDKNARTNIPNDQVFLTEISDKIKDGFVIEQEELTFVDKVVQNTVVILPTAIVIIMAAFRKSKQKILILIGTERSRIRGPILDWNTEAERNSDGKKTFLFPYHLRRTGRLLRDLQDHSFCLFCRNADMDDHLCFIDRF